MEIAYKVLSVRNGELYSAVVKPDKNPKFALKYPRNTIIKPAIGKIFVYKDQPTLRNLERLVGNEMSVKIFQCLVSGLTEAREIAMGINEEEALMNFWNGERGYMRTDYPLTGTYLCDSLYLVKDITKKVQKTFDKPTRS